MVAAEVDPDGPVLSPGLKALQNLPDLNVSNYMELYDCDVPAVHQWFYDRLEVLTSTRFAFPPVKKEALALGAVHLEVVDVTSRSWLTHLVELGSRSWLAH